MKKTPFLYTFLFGIFPSLFLLAHNAREIPLHNGLRAFVISAGGITLIYFLALSILRNKNKSALVTTFGSIIFFLYGHLYSALREIPLLNMTLARHRFLAPLSLFIFIIGVYFILRKDSIDDETTFSLNLVGLILLIIPLFQVSQLSINQFLLQREKDEKQVAASLENTEKLPDIYYIILDGYPRADILKSTFELDNSKFISWLEEEGFYVAACSQSNYSYTAPSMAATFNLNYLGSEESPNRIIYSEDQVNAMLQNSLVQETVTQLGYKTVIFDTEYDWLKWNNPDIIYSLNTDTSVKHLFFSKINGFEILLLETTFASVVIDHINLETQLDESIRQSHQREIVYTLEKLLEIPQTVDGPKFVYAHIVSPHPPFIFGADGRLLVNEPATPLIGYRDQTIYLNSYIQEFVSKALAESDEPPIIIIQGDHGAAMDYKAWDINPDEKIAILNAYYLPNMSADYFYPEISPINTFRLIFNHYFSLDYDLLSDLSILGGESPYLRIPCIQE